KRTPGRMPVPRRRLSWNREPGEPEMDLEVQMEPGLPGQIDPVAGHPGKRAVEPEPVTGHPGNRTMQAEPETLAIWKRKRP
ncbi:MAG: hypothetical protein HFG63_12850, partial [Lachnospiraceae bacterium]|nr:hypothetical protein [Lachnospiraceae bacterium]